ncbi:hypothetical protein ACXR6G_06730 [Ancylomarina sp. YFZ004]
MKKIIVTAIIAFVLGGALASLILLPQIENRYTIGHNQGFLDGGFEVIGFLDENLQNTNEDKAIDLNKHLSFKYISISLVKINGVKTIIIKD